MKYGKIINVFVLKIMKEMKMEHATLHVAYLKKE